MVSVCWHALRARDASWVSSGGLQTGGLSEAGGQVVVFPLKNIPVGAVGGWMRFEEISEYYYKYVRLSEGPMVGVRAVPFDHLAITGAYNPARHRITEDLKSMAKNGQFMLTLTAFVEIGGAR